MRAAAVRVMIMMISMANVVVVVVGGGGGVVVHLTYRDLVSSLMAAIRGVNLPRVRSARTN